MSIQAQVLNLFMELRAALDLTYLFISHDLGVVQHISRPRRHHVPRPRRRERAGGRSSSPQPNHPYTQALLAEVGKVEPSKRTFVPIKGEIPSPLDPPPGCHFHPRCPHAMPVCRERAPPLVEIAPAPSVGVPSQRSVANARERMKRRLRAAHDPRRRADRPLVLDSPHSGECYPDDFDHVPPRAVVRQAEDTHVARLWSHAPVVGATLIEAQFPRAYIDANRSLADIDPALLADAWHEPLAPSRKTEQGIGLVWRLARGGAPMYARKLTRGRSARAHRPLLRAVSRGARRRARRAPSRVRRRLAHQLPFDAGGRRRARRRPGPRARRLRARRSRRHDLRRRSSRASSRTPCAALGYTVAINDPYKGVELVRKHGRPAERRHSLQIEIKRTLYMDEETLVPNAGYARARGGPAQARASARRLRARGKLGRLPSSRSGLTT